MSLRAWASETAGRYRRQSVRTATKASAVELWTGMLRRTPAVYEFGETIWEHPHMDERPWDIIVVLDACRLDALQEMEDEFDWLGTSNGMWSVGSRSPEWMEKTFADEYTEQMAKTAYVSANPFTSEGYGEFGHLDEVWRTEWDDELATIPPDRVTDYAIDRWRRRDELGVDQVIAHYMQPHNPFRSRPDLTIDDTPFTEEIARDGKDYFKKLRDGEIEREELLAAYADNLRWALESVEKLWRNTDALIGITADHGNGFGEWGIYGHPHGVPTPQVKRVPWTTIGGKQQDSYEPDVPQQANDTDIRSESVSDRLQALGYQ